MKFYIPEIGDEIVLSKDWKFIVTKEYRNEHLIKKFLPEKIKGEKTIWHGDDYGKGIGEIIIPKGTVLSIDRIYIRKGASDYSSVTFIIKSEGKEKKIRFFAKLQDCNNIEFESRKKKDSIQIKEDYHNRYGRFEEYVPGSWIPDYLIEPERLINNESILKAEDGEHKQIATLKSKCFIEYSIESKKIDEIKRLGEKIGGDWEHRSSIYTYSTGRRPLETKVSKIDFVKIIKREYTIYDGQKKLAVVKSPSTLKTKMRELLKLKLIGMGYTV
jgi:hypothetical protein